MTLVLWILGINFAMVFVGLLGHYVTDELIANPHLSRVYGEEEKEQRTVWEFLNTLASDTRTPRDLACFLCGPYVMYITYCNAYIVWAVWDRPDPMKFLKDAVDEYLDDTQELPTTGVDNV